MNSMSLYRLFVYADDSWVMKEDSFDSNKDAAVHLFYKMLEDPDLDVSLEQEQILFIKNDDDNTWSICREESNDYCVDNIKNFLSDDWDETDVFLMECLGTDTSKLIAPLNHPLPSKSKQKEWADIVKDTMEIREVSGDVVVQFASDISGAQKFRIPADNFSAWVESRSSEMTDVILHDVFRYTVKHLPHFIKQYRNMTKNKN
jgi:hypothetical protein